MFPSGKRRETTLLLYAERVEHEQPVGGQGSTEATHGMRDDGLGRLFAVAQRVEHGGVCTQIAAPAHADGREDGDGVTVYPSLSGKSRHQAQGSTDGSKGRYREGYLMGIGETEEPVEQEIDLGCQPREKFNSLIGLTAIDTIGARAECENHDQRRDYQYARNDSQTDVDTRTATIEQRVEDTQEEGLLLLLHAFLLPLHCLGFDSILSGILRIALQQQVLHQTCGDDTANEGSYEPDEWCHEVALTYHIDNNDESHAKGGAEVGQRDVLELLEITGKALVLRQGDDSGIVA